MLLCGGRRSGDRWAQEVLVGSAFSRSSSVRSRHRLDPVPVRAEHACENDALQFFADSFSRASVRLQLAGTHMISR
ncbi:MAG TPA: hypothetical protein DCR20_05990 [Planctomycetaceae bacterium]|nr:hypothetical protein [Planctomycetaceae bacterium]